MTRFQVRAGPWPETGLSADPLHEQVAQIMTNSYFFVNIGLRYTYQPEGTLWKPSDGLGTSSLDLLKCPKGQFVTNGWLMLLSMYRNPMVFAQNGPFEHLKPG